MMRIAGSRSTRRLAAALCLLPALACGVRAEMIDHSFLLELDDRSIHAGTIRSARRGGFELSGGAPVTLRDWYRPDMPELTLRMLTQLSEGFGITWGLSTGERAEKYRIAPALHLGFILQQQLWKSGVLTLSASSRVGGGLTERPCEADYGEFGRMMVNCRLAATPLAPEDTLDHLLDADGLEASWVALQFEHRF